MPEETLIPFGGWSYRWLGAIRPGGLELARAASALKGRAISLAPLNHAFL